MTTAEKPKKNTKSGTAGGKTGATPQASPPAICPNCGAQNLSESRFCANCATPMKGTTGAPAGESRTVRVSTVELARGNRLAGRYEIIEELGQGGMGKVFKVYDHKISEVVALKLIHPEISVQEKAIQRFTNELKFTRKITHRNICRMYDLGEADFVHYITMEYVAGEDLKRFLKRAGSLNVGKAVAIARQVCEGLAEAHRVGAVHRDLKPQNIMIDHEGNAKIMDFGIARFTEMDRMTGSGVMIGTPEYMSPEQAELKEVDARADVYALGVVLFEMVTGKVPFTGETALSLAMKHKTEKPRDVRELNAQIPAGLAGVIAKCLEKDPVRRYQSAEEMKAALDAVEKDLATAERVVPPAAIPKAKAGAQAAEGRGKKNIALVAGGVVIVAAVAVFFILKFGGRTTAEDGPAADVKTQTTEPKAEGKPPESVPDTGTKAKPGEKAAPIVPDAKTGGPKQEGAKTEAAKPQEKPRTESRSTDTKVQASFPADEAALQVAKARMVAAKSLAEKKESGAKSLLFLTAEARENEAQKLADQKQRTEGRCLFTVAEKLYRICLDENKDENRVQALVRYMNGLRDGARAVAQDAPDDPSWAKARELVANGEDAGAKKDFRNAFKFYALAAFHYEKIRWTVQSAKKK